MALAVQKTGLVSHYTKAPGQQALTLTGYAMDQTRIREQPFWLDVPGDENGGPQGPPIDVQWLGETVQIQIEMSKWDATQVALLRKYVTATQGTILNYEVGTLMFANKSIELLCYAPQAPLPLYFPCCLLREPVEYGAGTKFASVQLFFTAYKHPTSGVLYSQDTTGITTTTTTTTTTGA